MLRWKQRWGTGSQIAGFRSGASHYSIILTCLQIFRTFLQVICSTIVVQQPLKLFLCIKSVCSQFYSTLNYAELCDRNWIKNLINLTCMKIKKPDCFILLQLYTVAIKSTHEHLIDVFRLKGNNAYCIILPTNNTSSVLRAPMYLTVQNSQRQWILF